MTDIVNRRRMRHAHMVNINHADHARRHARRLQRRRRLSQQVIDIVTKAKAVRAKKPRAPTFVAELNPDYKWIKTSGIISPDKWGNLPGGEVFTTPGEVNGTYVVDGVVGDYLCEKYARPERQPLTIHMRRTASPKCFSENKELEQEFWDYTHTDENSDRVGEFAIGTNIELKHVIGKILQDEKFPGIHIAFGNPYGAHTGAKWYFRHAHRCRRPALRHLARKPRRRRADHA